MGTIVGNIQSETTGIISKQNMYMKNWEAIGSDETWKTEHVLKEFTWIWHTLQWEALQPDTQKIKETTALWESNMANMAMGKSRIIQGVLLENVHLQMADGP